MSYSYAATLGNDSVEVHFDAEPYVPANFRGHPDNWAPAEGGDIEVVQVEYETCGRVWIDGKWVKFDRILADVTCIVPDYEIERIQEEISALPAEEIDP